MSAISINQLRQGIISTLSHRFGFAVHGEGIGQGFLGPCFFVALLETGEKHLLGDRYQRLHSFDVHFFPEQGDWVQERAYEVD